MSPKAMAPPAFEALNGTGGEVAVRQSSPEAQL